MLESKSKFNITSPIKDKIFSPDKFYEWSNNHMFRTSYNDMSFKVRFFIDGQLTINFSHQ